MVYTAKKTPIFLPHTVYLMFLVFLPLFCCFWLIRRQTLLPASHVICVTLLTRTKNFCTRPYVFIRHTASSSRHITCGTSLVWNRAPRLDFSVTCVSEYFHFKNSFYFILLFAFDHQTFSYHMCRFYYL